jgi:tetratricopeptide (TPR) repeat protein
VTCDLRGGRRRRRPSVVAVIILLVGPSSSLPAKPKHHNQRAPAQHLPREVVAEGPSSHGGPAAAPGNDKPVSDLSELLPETARVYQKSYDDEAAGRFAQALRALDVLPAAERASYLFQLRRGWLLYRIGRHTESIAAYHQAVAAEKESVEARVGCLMPQLALRDWAAVEEGARAVLDRDPANYLAGLRLAFAVYSAGRFADAEDLYRRVVARYPSDADARAGLGWSLLRQGKRADAREQFLRAARAAPRSAIVLEGIKASAG